MTRDDYIQVMADRFVEKAGQNPESALWYARDVMADYEADECPFGEQPHIHRWDRSCAIEVADENMEHWGD